MVTSAEVADGIDTRLQLLIDEVAFLPEMEAGWAQEPEVNRDVYYLEWRNLMGILKKLDHEYRSAAMTPDQEARYRTLLTRLRERLPIVQRLDLNAPTVPLEP